ncbi:hypothetical protein V8C43DRAFT_312285 [Trichoderma afarasin]
MPPSYQEATAASENVADPDGSRLDNSCVCVSHQGCCRRHNSLRLPNCNPLQPLRTSQALPIWWSNGMNLMQTEAGDSNVGTPSSNMQSALTLTPIHSAISYHLSLDNLRCIRRRIRDEVEKARIQPLSDKDQCTFLQKQKIICSLPKGYENSPERFTACPHQSMLNLQSTTLFSPSNENWSNTHGPYAKITACTICHLVTEYSLMLRNRNFYIKYTCYKDLGPGTDLHHLKWLALLTGAGNPHLQENRHERLYAHFWCILVTAYLEKQLGMAFR